MNNESKTNLSKSNVVENSSIINSEESKKDKDLSTSYVDYNEKKNEGCNDWTSVPRTYDKEESCHKHEKTATNNQWCSCTK
jgi:hypothetical protein